MYNIVCMNTHMSMYKLQEIQQTYAIFHREVHSVRKKMGLRLKLKDKIVNWKLVDLIWSLRTILTVNFDSQCHTPGNTTNSIDKLSIADRNACHNTLLCRPNKIRLEPIQVLHQFSPGFAHFSTCSYSQFIIWQLGQWQLGSTIQVNHNI